MSEPKIDWDNNKRIQRTFDPFYGGKAYDNESLHKNCECCPHVVNSNRCKFVRFPKLRKWPCFFRENICHSVKH